MSRRKHKKEQAAKQAKLIKDWTAAGVDQGSLPSWAFKRSSPKKKQ